MTQHDELARMIFDEIKAHLGPLYSRHLDRVLDVDDVLDAVHLATDDEADARLIAAAPDLLMALKMARECIAYCRRTHPDVQKGEGVPIEFIIDDILAKATQE